MTAAAHSGGRLRAYLLFIVALIYFFAARSLAHHAAQGYASDVWLPLVEQAILVFLLLVVYGGDSSSETSTSCNFSPGRIPMYSIWHPERSSPPDPAGAYWESSGRKFRRHASARDSGSRTSRPVPE